MSYHVRKDGTPDVCRASVGRCPLGGIHYASLRDAVEAVELGAHETDPLVGFGRFADQPLSVLLADRRYCYGVMKNKQARTRIEEGFPQVYAAIRDSFKGKNTVKDLREDFRLTTGEQL